MDRSRFNNQTKRHDCQSRSSVPVRRKLHWPWFVKYNNNQSNNSLRKCYRNNLSLLAIILFSGSSALANTSQTAAPVANTSASLTNMAIQTLQGNLIQNQYGGGVVCQGPMVTFSPFITDSHTFQKPREYLYDAPVYDDDGNIIYHQQTRTGQKDNFSLNLGASLTFSMPLDKRFQERCLKNAKLQGEHQQQLIENKKLDWHIARLKQCGLLKRDGIEFAANSPYFNLCEDVVVKPKMGQVLPHRHLISSPSKEVNPVSHDKQ